MEQINIGTILFLDIETVSSYKNYEELSSNMQELWKTKSRRFLPKGEKMDDETAATLFHDKAAILSEFGKIICISVGFVHDKDSRIRVKSISGDDERQLLEEFVDMLESFAGLKAVCGHNIKEFDVPYICRRMLVLGMRLPAFLNLRFKKPWEMKHIIDTMELWKFGDYKHYTSLSLLAEIFGVPTPKDDIDGSMVTEVYWKDNDLDRIVKYCEKDVVATINVFLKLISRDIIPENRVEVV